MSYLARRLLACAFQLWLLSVLVFVLLEVVPGDFYTSATLDTQASPGAVEQWRADHGLRLPWTTRYIRWIASAFRGEWGRSLAYEMPVLNLLRTRIGKTLQIVIPSLALCWIAGLGMAIWAVRKRRQRPVELLVILAALLPDAIAVSLMMWLAVGLRVNSIATIGLPVACLTLILLPSVILHSTNALTVASQLAFVGLAAHRGIAASRLWRSYLLPAAANPLISLAGLSLASAVGTSLLVEILLGWPGLGPMFLEAAQTRDSPIVASVVLMLGAVFTVSSLLADLALYRLDPRIRLRP